MAKISRKQFITVIFLLVLASGCSDSSVEAPLRLTAGQTGAFPAEISLHGGWSFFRFSPDEVFDPAIPPVDGWTRVVLPHTAKLESRVVVGQWQGDALYRRDLFVPGEWEGEAIWLRFEGAMMVARVYLNGEEIFEHRGGYLPFTIDLSDKLSFGENNQVLVHLENRNNPLTGPKPLHELDFNYYGGLYREVRLFVRDSLHITDEILADRAAGGGIFVTYPNVTQSRAEVSVKTHVANSGAASREFTIDHTLMDGDRIVASFSSGPMNLEATGDLEHTAVFMVEAPKLWSPRTPALYKLSTRLVNGDRVVDKRKTQIGIRRIEISKEGFSINGEEMFLRGVNRHQEYPYVGYRAVSQCGLPGCQAHQGSRFRLCAALALPALTSFYARGR